MPEDPTIADVLTAIDKLRDDLNGRIDAITVSPRNADHSDFTSSQSVANDGEGSSESESAANASDDSSKEYNSGNSTAASSEDVDVPVEEMLPSPVESPVATAAVPVAVPAAQPVLMQHAPIASGGVSPATLLGTELANEPAISGDCAGILQDLSQGDQPATELVGQLMIFRSAAPDRMAKLLKEVGEAYFRWQPYTSMGDPPLLVTLVSYLTRICEANGLGNTIKLCRAGDRYDATRHSAKDRGIEVSNVHGWIVLRENGKVFSKASVAVK